MAFDDVTVQVIGEEVQVDVIEEGQDTIVQVILDSPITIVEVVDNGPPGVKGDKGDAGADASIDDAVDASLVAIRDNVDASRDTLEKLSNALDAGDIAEATARDAAIALAIRTFVQPNAPDVPVGAAYMWIQTGLGDGSDFTFWFEDGE